MLTTDLSTVEVLVVSRVSSVRRETVCLVCHRGCQEIMDCRLVYVLSARNLGSESETIAHKSLE